MSMAERLIDEIDAHVILAVSKHDADTTSIWLNLTQAERAFILRAAYLALADSFQDPVVKNALRWAVSECWVRDVT